jgi:UDP-N-acetylglucosamine 2-epimerase (non-hydrolysing)/UDP-GlcNAc3NAcA epimerase
LTDSGGVQREAYFLAIPCITLREETELTETVQVGWNRLVGSQPERIIETVRDFVPPIEHPPLFGDGHAADYIANVLTAHPTAFGQNYDRVAMTLPANVPVR